jgi:hypothetical protein
VRALVSRSLSQLSYIHYRCNDAAGHEVDDGDDVHLSGVDWTDGDDFDVGGLDRD